MKTFPGSSHRGLIAGRATEAAAQALCASSTRCARAGREGAALCGPVPWPWAVGQATLGSAGPGWQVTAHCARWATARVLAR
jgi:hypothetical protein